MQFCKYLIILLTGILPASSIAQSASIKDTDITGLWKGTIYNDTTKKFYKYEIGISEEKGKLSGFSHTWFILDDKEYYGVKKLKIKIASDGKLIVEDAGLIANNYPVSPAKGVKQLNVLTLEIKDSIMTLAGPYETNRTRLFSALTGTVSLQRKNDFWQSALVPHLQELGLSEDLSFVKQDQQLKKEEARKEVEKTIALKSHKEIEKGQLAKSGGTDKEEKISKETVAKNEPSKGKKSIERSAEKEEMPGKISKANTIEKNDPNDGHSKIVKETIAKNEAKAVAVIVPPAAEVDKRTTVLQQTVYFNSDSLQLSLYDNGEVDGDTVSVLMNGKIIMAKEGLSTKAIQKTIYADPSSDNIELVMYAENLGAIAPNTGLLVVHDGKSIYEIRFSGDLHKNASIILRRRKN